jgi:ferric-dicitrate binding protein FerR (iron transport regulator)
MSGPRYAALARKLLARRDEAGAPEPPDARERADSITAIEQAIASAGRKRLFRRWVMGAGTVAAAVALGAGAGHFVRRAQASSAAVAAAPGVQIVAHAAAGGANLMGPGGQAPLLDGRTLVSGSRIVTPPNGQATLSFSTGTTASLGSDADLSIDEDSGSQVLHLAGGSVDLHVAKLAAGQRFLVDTVDAEVEVRGTRFHVEIADPSAACAGGVTRVAVSEGVVVVRHAGVEARVEAGESWPKGCAATATPASKAQGGWSGGAGRGGKGWRAAGSDLGGQNDLYAEGTRAWHRGDGQAALAAFDQLIARFPNGPDAETACVERMRVLRSIAPDRAPASAREYIARYPSGFARAEAEALLQGSP